MHASDCPGYSAQIVIEGDLLASLRAHYEITHIYPFQYAKRQYSGTKTQFHHSHQSEAREKVKSEMLSSGTHLIYSNIYRWPYSRWWDPAAQPAMSRS